MNKEFDSIIFDICEKIEKKQSIVTDLVEYYSNKDLKQYVYNKADIKLMLLVKNYDLDKNDINLIILSLCMISMYEYDGKLWEYIQQHFPLSYSKNSQKVDTIIRNLLKPYIRYFKYSNQDSYISVPLIACGVTRNKLYDFFEFSLAIYRENLLMRRDILDYELESEIYNTFSVISEINYNEYNDDIQIAIGKNKVYKLSKYTQSALRTGTNCEGLAEIASYCVRCIIKYIDNEPFNINEFYSDAFRIWKENYCSKPEKKIELNDSKRWYANIKLENNNFILYTKTQKIDSSIDELQLEILEDGKVVDTIYDEDIERDDVIGGQLIKYNKIILNCNILNNISYRYISKNGIIGEEVTSKQILKEDGIIFFDEHGSQIKSGNDYAGPLFIISKTKFNDNSILTKNSFYITEIYIENNDEINVDGKNYFFCEKIKPGIRGDLINAINVFSPLDNVDIPVYKNIRSILFESKEEPYFIEIDNKFTKVDIISHKNNVKEIKLENLRCGYHKIYLCDKDHVKLNSLKYFFIIDNKFEKNEKIFDDLILCNVKSSFLNVEKEIKFGELYFSENCYIDGLGKVIADIQIESTLVSIDKENWYHTDKRFNYDKIPDYKLFIIGSPEIICEVYTDDRTFQISCVKSDEKGYYEINLLTIESLKTNDDLYFMVKIKNKGKVSRFYFDYYAHIEQNQFKFDYVEKSNKNIFSLKNEEDIMLTGCIKDSTLNKIINKFNFETNKTYSFNNILLGFKLYDIVLYQRKGLLKLTQKEIFRKQYYFNKKEDLIGKIFKITEVEIYNNDSFEIMNINSFITLKIIGKNKEDPNYFVGTIKKAYDHFNIYKKLGLLIIDPNVDFINDKICFYVNDIDGDQIFYDNSRREILETSNPIGSQKNLFCIERLIVDID